MPSSHACAFLNSLFAKHPKSEESQCVCTYAQEKTKVKSKNKKKLKTNHIFSYSHLQKKKSLNKKRLSSLFIQTKHSNTNQNSF